MKSVNDMTWKDAAVIEARSLLARLEDRSTHYSYGIHTSKEMELDLNRLMRQMVRLADQIDRIEEKPRKKVGVRTRRLAMSQAQGI